jgi:hypothetical protein
MEIAMHVQLQLWILVDPTGLTDSGPYWTGEPGLTEAETMLTLPRPTGPGATFVMRPLS